MLQRIAILLSSALLCFSCVSCQKEETSIMAGTAWECEETGFLLFFNDNQSGIYYSKASIDDVREKTFSSFDFDYEMSGNEITIHIYFSRRLYILDLIRVDDDNLKISEGEMYHYKRIHHILPEQQYWTNLCRGASTELSIPGEKRVFSYEAEGCGVSLDKAVVTFDNEVTIVHDHLQSKVEGFRNMCFSYESWWETHFEGHYDNLGYFTYRFLDTDYEFASKHQ